MSSAGPREDDGDYAAEFFGAYEREADRTVRGFNVGHSNWCSSWFLCDCDCGGQPS